MTFSLGVANNYLGPPFLLVVEFHPRVEGSVTLLIVTSETESGDVSLPSALLPAEVRVVVVVVDAARLDVAAVFVVATQHSAVPATPAEARHG